MKDKTLIGIDPASLNGDRHRETMAIYKNNKLSVLGETERSKYINEVFDEFHKMYLEQRKKGTPQNYVEYFETKNFLLGVIYELYEDRKSNTSRSDRRER